MKKNILFGIVILLNIGIIGVFMYSYFNTKKTVYLNNNSVFNEFVLKKELEKRLVNEKNKFQKTLDSLELEYKISIQGNNQNKANQVKAEFQLKKRHFDEETSRMAEEFDQQIWTQLNQYIKDYGKMHNEYDFILGVSGQGNLMYAIESLDITTDVVKYVNNRYEGATE
ncbi:MAG: OmpH family outer membrane protein [Bacteroidia bacterium]|nr:OmpH family outer membrane protein [Bacteroidia bacterium]